MREILFRGKDKDGKWHEGYYGILGKNTDIEKHVIIESTLDTNLSIDRFYFTDIEVIPETVGQFTGLIDKNGVKIFEGDVVAGGNVLCNGGFNIINDKCTVIFKSGMFKCGSMSLITFSNRCVVVGNIHENQELLNQ